MRQYKNQHDVPRKEAAGAQQMHLSALAQCPCHCISQANSYRLFMPNTSGYAIPNLRGNPLSVAANGGTTAAAEEQEGGGHSNGFENVPSTADTTHKKRCLS